MKLIVGKMSFFRICVDTKNEFCLGPFDFVILGNKSTVGYIDGEISILPNRKARKSQAGGTK